ncbi:hypothetical protein MIND_00422700 [Mycena indigotica]|uniref:Uncharacterized protein n=1 Tax=Mycena indigotica TaxID=2126181 RepID=A0A8H6SWB1_9AGAR|nr:uncharacterized protein MIND_00422700 [Mycena indigotica]KAF7306315.1 hypothetical protein MIND_00422700 [Mycena indigotica]
MSAISCSSASMSAVATTTITSDEGFAKLLGSTCYRRLVNSAVIYLQDRSPQSTATRLTSITSSDWQASRAYKKKWPTEVIVRKGIRKFCSIVCRALRAAGYHLAGPGEDELILAVLHDESVLCAFLSLIGGRSRRAASCLCDFDHVAAVLCMAKDTAVRRSCLNKIKLGLSDVLGKLAVYIANSLISNETATRREAAWKAAQVSAKGRREEKARRTAEFKALELSIEVALIAQQARNEGARSSAGLPPPPILLNQLGQAPTSVPPPLQEQEPNLLWVELFGPLEYSTKTNPGLGTDECDRAPLRPINTR